MISKITPFLWFDTQAEEAANLYVSLFPNSSIGSVSRHGDRVMTVSFQLDGLPFTALNGGPMYQFSEATSFLVSCESQAEIDKYWDGLSEGGTPGRCGWLKDKFGLSWQVVPAALGELLQQPGAMQAMMKMNKLDIAELEKAAGL
jgi:predicted 3-demethylubiquinone-9 3-methyltransferase (glyoxalase superfamily)